MISNTNVLRVKKSIIETFHQKLNSFVILYWWAQLPSWKDGVYNSLLICLLKHTWFKSHVIARFSECV